MAVYVETQIRAPIEAVWSTTQTPELHDRWDVRFTSITELRPQSETAPQRFRYTTRLGLGMAISGEGESLGDRLAQRRHADVGSAVLVP